MQQKENVQKFNILATCVSDNQEQKAGVWSKKKLRNYYPSIKREGTLDSKQLDTSLSCLPRVPGMLHQEVKHHLHPLIVLLVLAEHAVGRREDVPARDQGTSAHRTLG